MNSNRITLIQYNTNIGEQYKYLFLQVDNRAPTQTLMNGWENIVFRARE